MVGDAETSKELTDIGNFLDYTGKKIIKANVKNVKRQVQAPNRCRNVFAADRFQAVPNAQYGFWRRPQVLSFTERFDNRDEAHQEIPDLGSTIVQDELDGVIQWIMAAHPASFGACDEDCGGWYTPEEVKQLWTRGADPVRRFVEDCCRTGSLEKVGVDTFMESLTAFCIEIDQPTPTKKAVTTTLEHDFHATMPDLGSSHVRDRFEYHGIGLRTPIEATPVQIVSRLRHIMEDASIDMDVIERGDEANLKDDWIAIQARITELLELGPHKTDPNAIPDVQPEESMFSTDETI
jgi:hypothetical protein